MTTQILYMGPLRPFRGGGGVLGSLLIRALARQGFDIVAASRLSADDARLDPTLAEAGISLHPVAVLREPNPWDDADATIMAEANQSLKDTAQEIVKDRQPNVILVGRGDYGSAAMAIAEKCQCPFVMIDHGSLSAHYAGLTRVPEAFRPHAVLEMAACIISVSPSRAGVLRNSSFREVVVVPNGVDTELFTPGSAHPKLRSTLGLSPDTQLVAHISNLAPVKRVEDYLRAVRRMISAGSNAHFLVAGTGPNLSDLKMRARALGVAERVTFTGWLSAEQLAQLLRTIDIVVYPSEVEACPLAVLEAMAVGCAIVASDIAGHRENIQHGISGLLAPVYDTGTLAEMSFDLLGSETRRKALGAKAHEAARRRTIDKMASRYRDVLIRVAATRTIGGKRYSALATDR